MVVWFRCPLCGHLSLTRNLDKNFKLQTFNQHYLGSRGFKYEEITDFFLIAQVKAKIRSLYQQYFVDSSLFSDFSADLGSFCKDVFIKPPSVQVIPKEVRQYV